MKKPEKRTERRDRILDAARTCFIERGYQRTSLDHIIERTGGSRRNIYALFGDKEGLFEAVLRELMREILEKADVLPSSDMPPEDWLVAFGQRFLRGMLSPAVIAAFRQFIAVATERPDLGRQAYDSGPTVLHDKVQAYLDRQVAAGTLAIGDTASAARILTEMLKGDFQLRALMTGETDFTDQAIRQHVRKAVRLFLEGARSPRASGVSSQTHEDDRF